MNAKYGFGRGTVLTNLYFIILFPMTLINRDFAVGDDGWRCGDWLNVYRDVHHGLLEMIPCGEGVWETREMELRAEWEWVKLVHHD